MRALVLVVVCALGCSSDSSPAPLRPDGLPFDHADRRAVDVRPAGPPGARPEVVPDLEGAHARCGWIGGGDRIGLAAFVANASYFDVVHPKWFVSTADGELDALDGADDGSLLEAAAASGVEVVPMVAGAHEGMQAMLRDASLRGRHVQAL